MKISSDLAKKLSRGLWAFVLVCLVTETYVLTVKPSFGIYLNAGLVLMAVAMLYSVYSASVKEKKEEAAPEDTEPPIAEERAPGRLHMNLETVKDFYFGVGVLEAATLILKNFNLKLAEQGTWQGEKKKQTMQIDEILSEILYKCSMVLDTEANEKDKPHDC